MMGNLMREQIILAMKEGQRNGAELALNALIETMSATKDKHGKNSNITLSEAEALIKTLSAEILKSFNGGTC